MDKKNKKLIIDTIPFEILPQSLKQNLNMQSNDKVRLTGIIQRANQRNKNGRVYPKQILQRQMQRLEPLIKKRALTGQLDHPESSIITLQKVCMILTQYWWKGDQLYGTIQLTSNSPGQNVKRLILKDNVTVGISSRGMGSTRTTEQGQMIQDDFQLITFDVVSQPSTIGAWLYQNNVNQNYQKNNNKKKNKNIFYNNKINDIVNSIIINT